MHVAYPTGVYIHQDEPWYLNTLCIRVTCKVHTSRKPGNNCDLSASWKGGKYLQEIIPLGFHQCQLIAEKDEQIPALTVAASSFRTLGWSSSGPKALEGFKLLRSLVTPSLETTISSMKGTDLSRSGIWVCSFLLNTSVNWPLNSPLPFQSLTEQHPFHSSYSGVEYLGCLFLTIDVPIEISGVCLNITNQVIHIQIVLFSYISLDLSS